MIDTSAYEEMISTLNSFMQNAGEQCNVMDGAASDLADNMDGDEHSADKASTLSSCVSGIRSSLEGISSIIQGLQQELEQAQSAANF